jgi:hypothetical protein
VVKAAIPSNVLKVSQFTQFSQHLKFIWLSLNHYELSETSQYPRLIIAEFRETIESVLPHLTDVQISVQLSKNEGEFVFIPNKTDA